MSIPLWRFLAACAVTTCGFAAAEVNPLRQSVELVRAGRETAAEDVLKRDTFHPADSYSWRVEIAGRLIQSAFLARESGDMDAARKLAARADKHLMAVEQGLPPDSALAINALELRAVIAERFIGTSTEADDLRAEAKRRAVGAISTSGDVSPTNDAGTLQEKGALAP